MVTPQRNPWETSLVMCPYPQRERSEKAQTVTGLRGCGCYKTLPAMKRKAYSGVYSHCYQRAADSEILFYSVSEFLSFFTLICVLAVRYDVNIIALCLMIDHFHMTATAENPSSVSQLIGMATRSFSRESNVLCGRCGPLFRHSYGSAPKRTDKAIRTNIIYVGNNPVERHLVTKAEEYRWNFLAYYNNPHPFSEPLVVRRASWALRKAIKEVKAFHSKHRHLPYTVIRRLAGKLSSKEKQQFVDFVISTYNIIDYEGAIRYFGSYDKMISAMHVSTGSEYDIYEVKEGKSDEHYAKMARILLKKTGLDDIHEVLTLSNEERYKLYNYLQPRSGATPKQIASFLRVKIKPTQK